MLRTVIVILAHITFVSTSYLVAFALRFELDPPAQFIQLALTTLPILLIIKVPVFWLYNLYRSAWRYVSLRDIPAILKAVSLGTLIFVAVVMAWYGDQFPRSIFALDWLLCAASVSGARVVFRFAHESKVDRQNRAIRRKVIIVGCGNAGESLAREIHRNAVLKYEVVCLVDDDADKHGTYLHGIEVSGSLSKLPELCRTLGVHEILIGIPSATTEQRKRILDLCRQSGVPFRTVPGLNDLLQGRSSIWQLQEVRPEDLLGRDPIHLNQPMLRQELSGKRVMVTGAAGSIGAELCRQLAVYEPSALILFDQSESSLYFIDLELRQLFPNLTIVPVVGDILNRQRVEEVLETYRPTLLYHAAAYKHVPLMEQHPLEGISNNVFGTEVVAQSALRFGLKKFVLISTDKAVRPVGVMGMTKRVAELLLQSLQQPGTVFVAVRFGNVLGSEGSVLPLFRRQIMSGGPITVTDSEATRYFMLLQEAAQLVLQAGSIGLGGEVFFLDMGEPVRIMDLAENLLRMSGFEPGRDIPIQFTGLRPGERLRETLVMEEEVLLPTEHEKVLMVHGPELERARFGADLKLLRQFVEQRDAEKAVSQLKVVAQDY